MHLQVFRCIRPGYLKSMVTDLSPSGFLGIFGKKLKKYSNIILPYLDFPSYVRYVSTFGIVCMYVCLFSDAPYYIRAVSTYQDVYVSVCLCILLVIASDWRKIATVWECLKNVLASIWRIVKIGSRLYGQFQYKYFPLPFFPKFFWPSHFFPKNFWPSPKFRWKTG